MFLREVYIYIYILSRSKTKTGTGRILYYKDWDRFFMLIVIMFSLVD